MSLRIEQFRDPFDAAGLATLSHFKGNASGSVTPLMFPEDVSYQRHELIVPLLSNRRSFVTPGVVRRATHLQHVTHRRDREALSGHDLIDRRIDIGHSLRPKMANAFFKMSRSRSTRRNSSSNCRTRASNDSAAAPPRPINAFFH